MSDFKYNWRSSILVFLFDLFNVTFKCLSDYEMRSHDEYLAYLADLWQKLLYCLSKKSPASINTIKSMYARKPPSVNALQHHSPANKTHIYEYNMNEHIPKTETQFSQGVCKRLWFYDNFLLSKQLWQKRKKNLNYVKFYFQLKIKLLIRLIHSKIYWQKMSS